MSKLVEKHLEDIIDFSLSKTNSSKFTKSFINKHKGTIPVYGASLDPDEVTYGYVKDNLDNIRYFDNCLTWNIDGSTGIFFRKGHFSLSEKVIPLVLFKQLDSKISLDYLRLSIIFSPDYSSFDFSHKAGKGKLKKFKVNIPVNDKGEYDLDEQQRLVYIYTEIETKRDKLLNRLSEIDNLTISINAEEHIEYKDVPLLNLFTPKCGRMDLSKAYCNKNKGSYPVYSGTKSNVEFGYINTYDYDGSYLTWIIDGLAGYLQIVKGKFSITCHKGVLLPTANFNNIDLNYVMYVLEPIFRTIKKGRLGEQGKNEYTALKPKHIELNNPLIPIPIKPDGTYDLEKQKEIANKYRQIDEIKQGLIEKIKSLVEIKIVPSE